MACALCNGHGSSHGGSPLLCASCANADLSILWARSSKTDDALRTLQANLALESAPLARSFRLSQTLKGFTAELGETRRKIEATEARIRDVRASNQARRARLQRMRQQLAEARAHLDNTVTPTVARLTHAAESMEEAVAMERRKRALELHDVLPMDAGHRGSVAGVWMTRFDDKEHFRQLALALALVARAVMIVASYIRLPLPFRMALDKGVVRLSRFVDATSCALLPWDPLFASATKMLWRNISTLCVATGVPSNLASPRDLVSSMWQVFHSPSLGGSVRQALLDSRAREARTPAAAADEPEDFVLI